MKLTITREATTQLNEVYNAIEAYSSLDSRFAQIIRQKNNLL